MQIKKAGGKIFGASLTAAEQKAMKMSSKQRSKRRPPQPHTTRRLLAEWSITKRQQMIC